MGIPENKLAQEVSTSWNSKLGMLRYVLKSNKAISAIVLEKEIYGKINGHRQ
jgi:hypothetical protein